MPDCPEVGVSIVGVVVALRCSAARSSVFWMPFILAFIMAWMFNPSSRGSSATSAYAALFSYIRAGVLRAAVRLCLFFAGS